MQSVKYIIRFDLPLSFVSVENNAEGIFDIHYDDLDKALNSYMDIAKEDENIDLIAVIDNEEYCLL